MKTFLQSYLGALLAGFTFFLFGFLFILASGGSKDSSIESDSSLVLRFSGEMKDHVSQPAIPFMEELFGGQATMSMEEMLKNITKASTDDRISSIFLDLDMFAAGTAQLREIRQALMDFKSTGKPIYAYGQVLTRSSYYLGSVADSLVIAPDGIVEWNGLSSIRPYFKGALDKLGVEMQLIRGSDNAFKSAGEPFIAEHMSDSNRVQLTSYLTSIWNNILVDIEKDGRISGDQLDHIAESGAIIHASEALDYGMVDALAFEDEFLELFLKDASNPDYDHLKTVSLRRFNREFDTEKTGSYLHRVAVVYAEGEVALGKSSDGTLGSETIVKALRDVRTNDQIAAVVLRINSPGGVSLAGDAMWREVQLTAEAKPLVVSMGNVAASAGYLIAAPADSIFVQPQTITGSIGVFAMLPAAPGLIQDKLGIHFETVSTHPMGTIGTPDRLLTEEERLLFQRSVDETYSRFRQAVADGRGLPRETVDKLAKGRVWTGEQALANGLADAQGGLYDAIRAAERMADIEPGSPVSSYPEADDPFSEWLNSMQATSKTQQLKSELGPLYSAYIEWQKIQSMTGLQMRLPEYNAALPL